MTTKTEVDGLWRAIYQALVKTKRFQDPNEGLARAEEALARHFLTSRDVLEIVDAMIAGKPALAADGELPLSLKRSWMVQPLIELHSESLVEEYGVTHELIDAADPDLLRLCSTFRP